MDYDPAKGWVVSAKMADDHVGLRQRQVIVTISR